MNPLYITFGLYLLLMIFVGITCCRKMKSTEDYFLGNRGLGAWLTAFSAQASDMSGWLIMGLPGAVYMFGLGEAWVGIGLAIGTLFNWVFIAPRLRIYTEQASAVTISSFFAYRFHDPSNLLRTLSALIIVLFFTIYVASGLVASGKLFNSMFGLNYNTAVLIGAGVILLYTLLGGYLAVCWTDMFQGLLMIFALTAVPLAAFWTPSELSFAAVCEARNISLSLLPSDITVIAVIAIISNMVWGLGYCGQPHFLTRFMSIKSVKLLPRSTIIAMIWVVISLSAAVCIGLSAIPFYDNLSASNSENVFFYLIKQLFNPWIGGILLSAVLAAIMSTIDSQLLVTSSALTEDFYQKVLKRSASQSEMLLISRLAIAGVTIVGCVLALMPNQTIFGIVKFAWGGFGAAFGPVIIMALYSRRTTWQSALCGMLVGTVVMLGWYAAGWNKQMYEILPGFAANWLTIVLVNRLIKQRSGTVLSRFDQVIKELHQRN